MQREISKNYHQTRRGLIESHLTDKLLIPHRVRVKRGKARKGRLRKIFGWRVICLNPPCWRRGQRASPHFCQGVFNQLCSADRCDREIDVIQYQHLRPAEQTRREQVTGNIPSPHSCRERLKLEISSVDRQISFFFRKALTVSSKNFSAIDNAATARISHPSTDPFSAHHSSLHRRTKRDDKQSRIQPPSPTVSIEMFARCSTD